MAIESFKVSVSFRGIIQLGSAFICLR